MAITKEQKANPRLPRPIKIKEKMLPVQTLINGKEIREAAKALEDFRLQFAEEEFMQQASIMIRFRSDDWHGNGKFYAVVSRLETPAEVEARIKRTALANRRKQAREKKRKLAEAKLAIQSTARSIADLEKRMAELKEQEAKAKEILEKLG